MQSTTQTEEKILQAASQVFIKKGKQGARMQEIAETANINKAMLHYYFRSKERLYQHVFQREVRTFMENFFQSIPYEGNIKDMLHFFIHNYIDKLQQNPKVMRFMLWEIDNEGQNLKTIMNEIRQEINESPPQKIIEKLSQAISQKKIRPYDPHHLLFNIIGMCISGFLAQPIIPYIFPGIEIKNPDFTEKRKEEIFKLVWNGIRT